MFNLHYIVFCDCFVKVCEEKQQNWEVRWRELNVEWEKRLRHQTEKAFKMEQVRLEFEDVMNKENMIV